MRAKLQKHLVRQHNYCLLLFKKQIFLKSANTNVLLLGSYHSCFPVGLCAETQHNHPVLIMAHMVCVLSYVCRMLYCLLVCCKFTIHAFPWACALKHNTTILCSFWHTWCVLFVLSYVECFTACLFVARLDVYLNRLCM